MPALAQENRFLRAILAAPDDDGPRLVFADWLAERGSPRGEFIHIQCELARLPEADARRESLLARERQLQESHAQELAGRWHHRHLALRYHRGLPARFGHAGFFSSPRDDYRAVQRFFLDGQIVSVSTTADARPAELARWLVHGYEDHGDYTLTVDLDAGGLALRYASTSSYGTVEYEGLLERAVIHVRSHSLINDHRAAFDLALWGHDATDSRTDAALTPDPPPRRRR